VSASGPVALARDDLSSTSNPPARQAPPRPGSGFRLVSPSWSPAFI